ncbi:hypothetical protein NDI37_12095 [Funiculus sociatus GB2-A5]|uniref:Uncharacterized protein n=1 Tax=Funiculus sociatus GB2-A5 TaxID=2933946 RepID=A0ABV0JRD2_9CYAN|nr:MULTISPECIES: hypothetical protein [unclassified Trichocoleus]MBD1907898.1 hypothetical protein [Trichocoleus sp. FACHB-832]MBD2064757.1 hypothetical protein [Trichocoleus sp. FACHB-6]
MLTTSNFLYPQPRYYGDVNPENLVFNANLQEFAQRVSLISGLATNGKISIEQAFQNIETLWHQLEATKKQLGVGENPFQSDENR